MGDSPDGKLCVFLHITHSFSPRISKKTWMDNADLPHSAIKRREEISMKFHTMLLTVVNLSNELLFFAPLEIEWTFSVEFSSALLRCSAYFRLFSWGSRPLALWRACCLGGFYHHFTSHCPRCALYIDLKIH